MTPLTDLWLPILLSSVFVFLVSAVVHMALPWHKSDFGTLSDEEKILDALRPFDISPGEYMLPKAGSTKELGSPEFKEKLKRGPVVMMTAMPNGGQSMGMPLVLWFLYSVVIGIFAGYVAGRALPSGTEYLQVFRFVGATAFLGYAAALWQQSIWYARPWSTTIKNTIDGLVYALLTAGTFGWLWPQGM
jgi:hypothetical protein